MKNLLQKLGVNIRKRREGLGISQEELAYRSGYVVSYISQVENGKRSPTITFIYKIAKALKVNILKLLEGVE